MNKEESNLVKSQAIDILIYISNQIPDYEIMNYPDSIICAWNLGQYIQSYRDSFQNKKGES